MESVHRSSNGETIHTQTMEKNPKSNVATAHPIAAELRGITIKIKSL